MKPLLSTCVLTIFPEFFPGPLGCSLAGQALKKNIWQIDVINIRDFGYNHHKNVDDQPYGGGNGMVLRADVLGNAIEHAINKTGTKNIVYMSPRGKILNQRVVKEIIDLEKVIILCGRFEGIDERVIEEYNVLEISIGDYILSGGELAALSLIDACVRLLPGVLANQDTLKEESFNYYQEIGTLIEYPHYTRPYEWHGRKVPDVLLSGNHKQIENWRIGKAKEITAQRRPDLLDTANYKGENK